MILLKLIFALGLPWGLGFLLVSLLMRKHSWPFWLKVGLSYGLGMGLLSQWMLLLGMAGISFRTSTIGIPLLALVLGILIYLRRQGPAPSALRSKPAPGGIDWIFCLLAVFVLYNLYFVFWRGSNVPISQWDAYATVSFKAKVFYYDRSLQNLKHLPHAAYPLHIPFLQTWIALNLGSWSDYATKLIFPFAFLSFLIVQYQFLRGYVSRRWAMAGCALICSSNLLVFHAGIGYRDFFLLYYNSMAVMLMLLWHRNRQLACLALASLFAGFAAFVKVEGGLYLLVLTAVMLLLLFLERRTALAEKGRALLCFLVPGFGLAGLYRLYIFFQGIGLEKKAGLMLDAGILTRIPAVLDKIYLDLFLSGNWSLVWLLVLVSLFQVSRIRELFEVQVLLLALALYFGLIMAIAVLTKSFIWLGAEFWTAALSRITLHFFPLATWVVVLMNAPLNEQKTSQ